MEIVYWKASPWESDGERLKYCDAAGKFYAQDILSNYKDKTPALNSVEIETINRCNNDCSFCPVSVGHDTRVKQKMDEKLFANIIDELSAIRYNGYVSLFSNNEPLLDARIFDFLKYAKMKLPFAKHAMYTNGILLTPDKYNALTKYLDYLVIDNYNDDFKLNSSVEELKNLDTGNCKVRVEVRKKNQVLSNRGGLAPNKISETTYTSPCILPFMQMVIRPDGKASLCCQDAYGEITLGNVAKDGVKGVWEGATYKKLRGDFITKGRSVISKCSFCDLFDLHNYFPKEWIHFYINAFINALWRQKKQDKILVVVGSADEAGEISDLLFTHGIETDKREENVKNLGNDKFYIFLGFDWENLKRFKPEEFGKKFIIWQNPVYRVLQKQMPDNSLKTLYGKIFRAALNDKLIIFGAGQNAKKLYEKYDLKPKFYLDNNKERIGDFFLGKEIVSPDNFSQKDNIVLVSANDFTAIRQQLLQTGISEEKILNGNRLL